MSHKRKISVIGLGYVGLPVAIAFANQGRVIGFDVNPGRIKELQDGYDRTGEVEDNEFNNLDILFTAEAEALKEADFHIVAVPTPINEAKFPDLSPLLSASKTLAPHLSPGDIVVYESTVYPGATREDCLPLLEEGSGLKGGEDFFIGYSPERINPGDKEHSFTSITKVISGQDDSTLSIIADVYGSVVTAGLHHASSIEVAEAAKVIENTQRDLNIALMNELALIFNRFNIDTGDVLEAAGTKWNFLPFRPGLVGGHCIGVDPYYLTYKASKSGYIPQVILAGRSINDGMGKFIVSEVIKGLIQSGENVAECIVTVLGVTFKEDVPDIRNTRVVDVISELDEYGINVQVHDPVAEQEELETEYGISLVDTQKLKPAHAVILAVSHQEYVENGWAYISNLLTEKRGLVFDVKGALDRDSKPENILLKRL
jgi:UDP-N-acetyl-D-glucosamine/UDP-N-acetyl-D-galactosamine dehydrogenase